MSTQLGEDSYNLTDNLAPTINSENPMSSSIDKSKDDANLIVVKLNY